VVAAPFAALPFAAAYAGWTALQLALIVAAVLIASRFAPWPADTPWIARRAAELVALGAAPVLFTVMLGQFDGFLALGVAVAYACWRRGRSTAAGLALGLGAFLAKPHLALGLLVFAIGRRDWRTVRGLALGAGAWLAVTLLASGPAAWADFPHAMLAETGRGPAGEGTWFGLVGSLFGMGTATNLVTGVGEGLFAAVVAYLGSRSRRLDDLETTLAGAVLLTLLMAVHAKDYDLVLLCPMAVALFARAAAREPEAVWPGTRGQSVLLAWIGVSAAVALSFQRQAYVEPALIIPLGLAAGVAAAVMVVARSRPAVVPHPAGAPGHLVAAPLETRHRRLLTS
jgi:hypothetical protein